MTTDELGIRPRRSALFMPGSNPRALDKARDLPADCIIMDFEDSVSPAGKDAARENVRHALEANVYGDREVIIRVNGLSTPWCLDDIQSVVDQPIHGILFPKVDGAADVVRAGEALDSAGHPEGLPIWVMVETPVGVENAIQIAQALGRVSCLVVGTADLAKELRVPDNDPTRLGLLESLSRCVRAARLADLTVLDGVYMNLKDGDGLRALCDQGCRLGFDGKTLIHPAQIDVANEVFSPRPETIAQAKRIIEGWSKEAEMGHGVAVVDGRLVEHLHVQEARRLISIARALGIEAIRPDT